MEVAERSDVVICIVTDSSDVEEVLLGPRGVINGARNGIIAIDMSTISPAVTRRIAEELAVRRCSWKLATDKQRGETS
jgi:3-hydroxyisobutyrate dehydrogenase-like beta-hydroxyacid dehydrogenase